MLAIELVSGPDLLITTAREKSWMQADVMETGKLRRHSPLVNGLVAHVQHHVVATSPVSTTHTSLSEYGPVRQDIPFKPHNASEASLVLLHIPYHWSSDAG